MPARILTLAVVIAFACPVDAAPVPKPKSSAEKLIGRWELTKSRGQVPSTPHFVEFAKDGTMTLEVGVGKDGKKYPGTYKLIDDVIDYELKFETPKSEKLDIKSFTDDELKVSDPDKIEEEFKRVKPKDQ